MGPLPIRGRGTAENPAGRYERLVFEPDPELAGDEEEQALWQRTHYFRDHSRSIIASNDSPDVGFTFSVNPYRGCSHGCSYCLAGDTPILMADGSTRPLAQLRVGDEIYGTRRAGAYRRYERTRVLAHWGTVKPAYEVRLEDGTALVASGDHRFLTDRGWKYVTGTEQGAGRRPHLTAANRLMGYGRAAPVASELSCGIVRARARLRVASVRPLGLDLPLYDITTGTGDFIANGVVSHNCYARPTHEWLGLSAGLDFESRIFVKEDAPELLRRELASPRWSPAPISFSGVTDAYQPVEERLRLTRRCLEVLVECRNPVGVITKSHRVVRDADLLAALAEHRAAAVYLSITTLDPELQRAMEPRAATPQRRLDAVAKLAAAGVPVGVMVAPVIPGLTDHEIPAILSAAAAAGARTAGFVPLRLPHGVADLFTAWLERNFPERAGKVLHRVRGVRGGKLNDPRFGSRMRGEGAYAEQLRALFHVARRRAGMSRDGIQLSTAAWRRPPPPPAPPRGEDPAQLGLFP